MPFIDVPLEKRLAIFGEREFYANITYTLKLWRFLFNDIEVLTNLIII